MLMTILALVVSAAIDSTTLYIGDQTDMRLSATCQEGEKVIFPTLEKELIPGVEIVEKSEIESKKLGNTFTNGLLKRAVTFQSMSRMSSPN